MTSQMTTTKKFMESRNFIVLESGKLIDRYVYEFELLRCNGFSPFENLTDGRHKTNNKADRAKPV